MKMVLDGYILFSNLKIDLTRIITSMHHCIVAKLLCCVLWNGGRVKTITTFFVALKFFFKLNFDILSILNKNVYDEMPSFSDN